MGKISGVSENENMCISRERSGFRPEGERKLISRKATLGIPFTLYCLGYLCELVGSVLNTPTNVKVRDIKRLNNTSVDITGIERSILSHGNILLWILCMCACFSADKTNCAIHLRQRIARQSRDNP